MLILAKSMLALFMGFIITVVFGLFFIPFLKKINFKQKISVYLTKRHSKKDGTPTMGGLIFIIPTILTVIIMLLMGRLEFSPNLFIIMFVFIAYAILGFVDDLLIVKKKNNEGISALAKLIGQAVIAIIFFIIFLKIGNKPELYIHTLNIRINMGYLYGLFLLLILVASSNAVNLTDGLDGLAGGLSAIAFLAFAIISYGSPWAAGHEDIAIFCFILTGSLFGFLVYNNHPAKVFMGDTGSLSLGATLASVAIITSHELVLIVVAGVFVIETLSSIAQTISVMLFGKKIFLMAPIHHHFEKLGFEERTIVNAFWFAGLVFAAAGVIFSVWI